MLVFYVAFIVIGLCGIFLFYGNQLLCGLLIGVSAAGIGLRLFGRGKLKRFSALPALLCMVLCLFAGQTGAEGGMGDYGRRIRQAAALVDKGDLDGASALLDELEREFGETDLSLYARAEIWLALGEYDRALDHMNRAQDKTRQDWYEYMERILGLQGTERAMEQLEELYLDGARDLSQNGRMQYMAGLVKLGGGAYQSAAHYFARARELDEGDGRPCYYLGLICREQGDAQRAEEYFAEALERGVDEEMRANVQWYME